MKKFFVYIFIVVSVSMLFCSCLNEEEIIVAKTNEDAPDSTGKNSDCKDIDHIEEKLDEMTLEEKIGQMVMIGIHGKEINDDVIYSLKNFHFGGVILFDRNLENTEQTKKLVEDIKKVADSKVPLLFAIDEEGGQVVRGVNFLPPAPSQESIGREGNSEDAKYWAKYNANLLKSIGVNINFAPVADVGSRDTRSFSSNTSTVTKLVEATVQGYEEERFLYTLKHFPGIGKSKVDPHHEVSSIEVDMDTLIKEDIPPFKSVIKRHDNTNFMIMVGHLKYNAIDPTTSASLSPIVMTELLRDELGFSGVVITDDLEMGAIKNNVDLSTLGVKIIQAGGDIALVCHEYASQQIVYNSILEAVTHGEISESRINESVRRILRLKSHLE